MELVKIFPGIVINPDGHKYSGYIEILGKNFFIDISAPHGFDDLSDIEIDCDRSMMAILNKRRSCVNQRIEKSDNIYELVVELKVLIETELMSQNSLKDTLKFSTFYSILMKEISSVGWEKVAFLSDSLLEIHFVAFDASQREHILKINVNENFPEVLPTCVSVLPEDFTVGIIRPTLTSIYDYFVQKIVKYQDFWNVMDEIDANTWVLEPENPTRGDTHRRISVAPSASLILTIDPKQPRAVPECKFLGPDRICGPLKEKLMSADTEMWDLCDSLMNNIKYMLGVHLPSPADTKAEEYKIECGICYMHLVDANIPDVQCEYTNCGQIYHQVCLYEWLRSLPNSRQSFSVIFGDCPYCSKPVSTKILSNS